MSKRAHVHIPGADDDDTLPVFHERVRHAAEIADGEPQQPRFEAHFLPQHVQTIDGLFDYIDNPQPAPAPPAPPAELPPLPPTVYNSEEGPMVTTDPLIAASYEGMGVRPVQGKRLAMMSGQAMPADTTVAVNPVALGAAPVKRKRVQMNPMREMAQKALAELAAKRQQRPPPGP